MSPTLRFECEEQEMKKSMLIAEMESYRDELDSLKQNKAVQQEQRDSELRGIRKQLTNFAVIYAEQDKMLREQARREREMVAQNQERALKNAAKRAAALRNEKLKPKEESRNKICHQDARLKNQTT